MTTKPTEEMLDAALRKIIGMDSHIDATPRGGRKVVHGPIAAIAAETLATLKSSPVEAVAVKPTDEELSAIIEFAETRSWYKPTTLAHKLFVNAVFEVAKAWIDEHGPLSNPEAPAALVEAIKAKWADMCKVGDPNEHALAEAAVAALVATPPASTSAVDGLDPIGREAAIRCWLDFIPPDRPDIADEGAHTLYTAGANVDAIIGAYFGALSAQAVPEKKP